VVQLLPYLLYFKSLSSLKFQRIMFVDQLFSYDGLFMMTWQNRRLFQLSLTNHIPKWFTVLESLLVSSPNISRQLLSQWIISSKPPTFPATIFF